MSMSLEYPQFLEMLQKALSEDEIKEKIHKIISMENHETEKETKKIEEQLLFDQRRQQEEKTRTTELNQKIKELNNQNAILRNQIEQIHIGQQSALQEKKQQLTAMMEQNTALNTQVKKYYEAYRNLSNQFSQSLKIYEVYQKLSPALKNTLSGIFQGETIEQFLFCGVQKQNVELLWDAIKIRAIDENEEELDELKEIFIFFFHAYNSTFSKPLFELHTVNENEKYDNEKHVRTSKSRVSGPIKETLLHGFININSKKIERKSIVKL